MKSSAGELNYTIYRADDGQWECVIHRHLGLGKGSLELVRGRHKSVTGALHTAQQMALDVLSAPDHPTLNTEE